MNRRQFLYTTGLVPLAALLQGSPMMNWSPIPTETHYNGLRYRGSQGGRIFVSADQGKTWAVHTNLGSMFQVLSFDQDTQKRLVCTVGFAGRAFQLVLGSSGKNWQSLSV